MIKVLLVDDHAVVRAGIQRFLQDFDDIEVAGEASSADEAIRIVRAAHFNVVVLDISLPGKNGVETLKQLKRTRPELPVLVLSMHPELKFAPDVLRKGASGYLQKDAPSADLVEAIRTIHHGKRYITPAVAELLANRLAGDEALFPHESLSDREREVFFGLARGEPVGQIARNLKLSMKTVSTYRQRLLEKMGFSSNADLTYYAIKNGLVE